MRCGSKVTPKSFGLWFSRISVSSRKAWGWTCDWWQSGVKCDTRFVWCNDQIFVFGPLRDTGEILSTCSGDDVDVRRWFSNFYVIGIPLSLGGILRKVGCEVVVNIWRQNSTLRCTRVNDHLWQLSWLKNTGGSSATLIIGQPSDDIQV